MVNYVFKPYNPAFPRIFEAEKNRLKQHLSEEYRIEHYGSTSIPGLGGKGIIDIFLIVPKEKLKKVFEEVKTAGYDARPKSGSKTRFVYVREVMNKNQKERYHLHIASEEENEDYKIDLLFRDYLRQHPEDAKRYAEIKKQAAKEAASVPQDQRKDVYMKVKGKVMEEILKKALM